MNEYGDNFVTKNISRENPFKIGEENVLLGINNPCTVITRSFVPLIELESGKFFKFIQEAGL